LNEAFPIGFRVCDEVDPSRDFFWLKINNINLEMEKPKFGPALNESVLRMAFLEQAANLLNTQSNDASPTCGLLGNLLLREMKEVGNVDQLRMHRDFKRSFCKR